MSKAGIFLLKILPYISVISTMGAMAAGVMALTGWATGHLTLASFKAEWIPMAPSTAVFFVLLSLALMLGGSDSISRKTLKFRFFAGSFTGAASLALLILSVNGVYLDIEHIGFEAVKLPGGIVGGHISPITASCFFMASFALLLSLEIDEDDYGRSVLAFGVSAFLCGVCFIFALVYTFGPPALYAGMIIPPAMNTVAGLLLLGIAQISFIGARIWVKNSSGKEPPGSYAFFTFVFILIITVVGAAGYFYYANYEKHFRKELENALSAIAELKSSQISLWRMERKGDAEAVFSNPVLKSEIKNYIQDPANSKINEAFQRYLIKFKEYYGYERVCFIDKNGVERITTGGKFPLSSNILNRLDGALKLHETSVIDFYINEYDQKPYIALIVPFFDEGHPAEPFGAMILNVDPYNVLYPFIEKWPSPTKSAETILVRREGDYVVFLNELKFKKNTALKLKFPLSKREIPAVKAVLGQTGVSEGIDYRGVRVIADTRPINDSPWFLVTRIDLEEVYGPLRERLLIMVFFTGIILLGAALGVGLLWSRRDANFYMKQLESEREKAWLQDIIEKSLNEIFVFSAETLKFKYLNTGARRNLGYSMHELYDITAYDIKPEFTEETFKAAVAPLIKKEKQVLIFETVHKRKDGSLYDVEVHLQLIERENESLFLAVINDITERKKIEKAVLKNEQKYRLLFKNMTSGFALHEIILDDNKKTCDYRFIEVNDSFEALTGAKAADIIGKTVKTIMPATEDYWIETYGKVALTGEAVRFENYSAAIGKFFEILAYSPEPGKFATIFQDITERKAIEKQILELNDCLEKRVAERTAQLEASNKELEAFAYSVSHDLRAPLRAIDGFSRFLAEDYGEKLDAEGNRLIKVVRDNTQKMDQLISDLLSLSRISRSEMSMAKIDMKKMAGLIYEEILTEEKKASYEWNCPQMPQAFGDPNLIRQVWHNLISNAVKYASRSTLKKIEAGGYILDGETVYFIKDTGVGFNPDYVNKLFGVFQRLHKSEEFEGNGVGLAIVQRIIHRHGGRVWAEGKINEGAAFYFTLPVKEN